MRTLKILGFLLTYPSEVHRDAAQECIEILQNEGVMTQASLANIKSMLGAMVDRDLLDVQEEYVDLFDRTPSLSLHLFEHVHGDSRERGQAMVDLSNVYEQVGLVINSAETPDYLPLFLEYLSCLSAEDIAENLGSVVNILSAIQERLKNRQSDYQYIFQALTCLASRKPDLEAVEKEMKKSSGNAYSLAQVDKEWEEQFAFENTPQTTGQNAGCPKAQEMLDRIESYQKKDEEVGQ